MKSRPVSIYVSIIILLIILAYSNTYQVPFIFDDKPNIVNNTSIHNTENILKSLSPPHGLGIADRPMINFSLAINYAISGENTWSYHLLNLIIHIGAALTLFGIIRRTMLSRKLRGCYGRSSAFLAFSCTMIWAIHPLQTQAVTYVIQRCESLMGLFFLLTFYCSIRGWQSDAQKRWHLAAILFFFMGVGSKEVIITAPFLLFFYDLTFSPRKNSKEVIYQSPFLYSGLLLGLITLVMLVKASGTWLSGRGNISFTPFDYWITQPQVILHYLKIFLWPYPLCLDYSWPIAKLYDAWPSIIIISVLIVASIWALWKRLPIGFLAVLFFTILLPTSVIPLEDIAFEHRMYLPSITPVVITVIGICSLFDMISKRFITDDEARSKIVRRGYISLLTLFSMCLLVLTYTRNLDYRSELSIWADTVQKHPENSRAQDNLGISLAKEGKFEEALEHFKESIRITPNNPYALNNMGNMLHYFRRDEEAITFYLCALRNKPDYDDAHNNLGVSLISQGKMNEAENHILRALQIQPNNVNARLNLAQLLLKENKTNQATEQLIYLLRYNPNLYQAYYWLGRIAFIQGNYNEAIKNYLKALSIRPDYDIARNNLSNALKHQIKVP